MAGRRTILDFLEMKRRGEKIVMLTSYDYIFTKILDEAGIDGILVGDSLGMVVMGYETTLPVSMEDMLHHVEAVVNARPKALVVADMPFMSYEASDEDALYNASKFIKIGADAVKLEGGLEIARKVKMLVNAGIPVMGHIGLNPQRIRRLGRYRFVGRSEEEARYLLDSAKALEEAGAFSIVLELVYSDVAKEITSSLDIPTIGIGSGPHCDGQILVVHDMLGLTPFKLSFVKRYLEMYTLAKEAIEKYIDEVRRGEFPGPEHYR